MNPHELKQLQTQLTKAKAESTVKAEGLKRAQSENDRAKSYVQSLEKKLAEAVLANQDPVVSEHALLRFIERIYGVDLDEVRNKILTPTTIKALKVMGSGSFPLEAGGRAVVRGNTIISITD